MLIRAEQTDCGSSSSSTSRRRMRSPLPRRLAEAGAFVKRMDHAVVLSADMEASRRVWGDVIGARLALDRTFPERNTRILFFRLADITIEISGGAAQSKEGVGKPDRFWGIAWGVDSIEATCARLAAAGIETSGGRARHQARHHHRHRQGAARARRRDAAHRAHARSRSAEESRAPARRRVRQRGPTPGVCGCGPRPHLRHHTRPALHGRKVGGDPQPARE